MIASINGHAASLQLIPIIDNMVVDSTLGMNLVISDLGDQGAPWLGAFDVDMSYDSNLLSLQKINYGTSLGDYEIGEVVTSTTAAPGTINLSELSYLEASASICSFCVAPYLEDLQGNSFTLAHLIFQTNQTGTATFGLTINALSDSFGDSLPATISNLPVITVAAVPIPSAAWLFLSTLSVARLIVRKKA